MLLFPLQTRVLAYMAPCFACLASVVTSAMGLPSSTTAKGRGVENSEGSQRSRDDGSSEHSGGLYINMCFIRAQLCQIH